MGQGQAGLDPAGGALLTRLIHYWCPQGSPGTVTWNGSEPFQSDPAVGPVWGQDPRPGAGVCVSWAALRPGYPAQLGSVLCSHFRAVLQDACWELGVRARAASGPSSRWDITLLIVLDIGTPVMEL